MEFKEARELLYWPAVKLLNRYIEEDHGNKEEVLAELKCDLEQAENKSDEKR